MVAPTRVGKIIFRNEITPRPPAGTPEMPASRGVLVVVRGIDWTGIQMPTIARIGLVSVLINACTARA